MIEPDPVQATPQFGKLVLLSRPKCHLCEQMLSQAQEMLPENLVIEIRSVDDDPELQQEFGLRIPVLMDDEQTVLCEGRLNGARLTAWIGAHY